MMGTMAVDVNVNSNSNSNSNSMTMATARTMPVESMSPGVSSNASIQNDDETNALLSLSSRSVSHGRHSSANTAVTNDLSMSMNVNVNTSMSMMSMSIPPPPPFGGASSHQEHSGVAVAGAVAVAPSSLNSSSNMNMSNTNMNMNNMNMNMNSFPSSFPTAATAAAITAGSVEMGALGASSLGLPFPPPPPPPPQSQSSMSLTFPLPLPLPSPASWKNYNDDVNANTNTSTRCSCLREVMTELWASTDVLFSTKLTWLLILGPTALLGDHLGILGEAACFCMAGIALIPCAERLSFVTEQVAEHTNGTFGALLNATFGNVPELLISISALRNGYYRVVQLAMLGSMLSNMLLIFGLACLVGGFRYQVQELRLTSGNVSVVMLLLATAGSLFPGALVLSGQFAFNNPNRVGANHHHAGSHSHSEFHSDYSDSNSTSTSATSVSLWDEDDIASQEEVTFCRVNAVVMFILYICYLLFQLGTHAEEFDEEPKHHKVHARRNIFCQYYMHKVKSLITGNQSSMPLPLQSPPSPARKTIFIHSASNSPQRERALYAMLELPPISPQPSYHSNSNTNSYTKSNNNSKHNSRHTESPKQQHRRSPTSRSALSLPQHSHQQRQQQLQQQHSYSENPALHPMRSLSDDEENITMLKNNQFSDSDSDDGAGPNLNNLSVDQVFTFQQRPHHQNHRRRGKRKDDILVNRRNNASGGSGDSNSAAQMQVPQSNSAPSAIPSPRPDNPLGNAAAVATSKLMANPTMNFFTKHRPLKSKSSDRDADYVDDDDDDDDLFEHGIVPVLQQPGFATKYNNTSAKNNIHNERDHDNNPSPSEGSDSEGPLISMRIGVVWLFIITICISALSDILVDTIDGFAGRLHISQVFTSMVIIPFFSNVAEQVSAVLFAYRNEMDLCIGVTVGSAIQIATMVLPGSVIIGMIMDRSMTLYFRAYETMALFFGTVVVAAILQGGTTNWLTGALLIGIYIMLASGIWFHELENLTVDNEMILRNSTEWDGKW